MYDVYALFSGFSVIDVVYLNVYYWTGIGHITEIKNDTGVIITII